MKQNISPGAMVGIIVVAIVLVVGIGYFLINRPPSDVPPLPAQPGGGKKLELPGGPESKTPTGPMGAPTLPGGGRGMSGPTLPGGGMKGPGTPP